MDVKIAFLNGNLQEEIYMDQLEGFLELGQESEVCKLTKSLYGFKQAPKQWHEKFDSCMIENCRVTICSLSPKDLGYEPNEPNTINLQRVSERVRLLTNGLTDNNDLKDEQIQKNTDKA